MKKLKIGVVVLTLIFLGSLLLGCSSENESQQVAKESGAENNKLVNEDIDEETPVILEMNGTEVKAKLNNTLTAQEFIKLLPYSVTVSRATDDLCGTVSEDLPADQAEGQESWKLGEIGWFGGWFTILVDNEEKFSDMPGVMIIGKIDDEYLDTISAFSGRVDIIVRLDESLSN